MFERFTKDARAAVTLAQEEAVRELGHRHIGPEHLLLALAQDDGPAGRALRGHGVQVHELRARLARAGADDDPLDPEALRSIGIDLDAVRRATEETFGEGALDAPPGRWRRGRRWHVPFSKGAKKSLELALRHAIRLRHNRIEAGHLLLGVLHDKDCPAVRILEASGVAVDSVRAEVTRLITGEAA
ncbi:Clp protease [Actinomadura rubrobrunea]|uniref:Clp protease n=1 Tax=Actinomadura rubrobrunea TaxID=115335 RepID=A0A9W6PTD6_9ACTN|nr:Clp protease N-terminal domain-containing protein [Actinomadura rubrobrunea]GLW63315.1 Clp protease [Actinomadura rubrobrunea]